ncbi:head-tail adaptor protein [Algoriphagus sp. D3-2-R+10]|uniref:head-tail adaptor protein n=1 Tax=Algoriphagus aurantiacus TaxID=3103948 RepID=UPI002B384891|nr:head-tail adaptor protein [Algoriphagus sp. D3-2-R+10]MEB2775229.1 head-tail adaptor protein [Algoriphagus sp. D3-2-R+10]
MYIGNFNRLIQIQQPLTIKNSFGEEIISWELLEDVYAEKYDKLVRNEKFEANQKIGYEESIFSIYYIEGVNSTMRIYSIDDDKYFEIVGVKEIGFKEGLQLMAYIKDNF